MRTISSFLLSSANGFGKSYLVIVLIWLHVASIPIPSSYSNPASDLSKITNIESRPIGLPLEGYPETDLNITRY